MTERVVITGMGAISALGHSVAENWESAINGRSGVQPITLFDTSDYLVKIACEVKNFHPEEYMPPKEARRKDRFEQFATIAAMEAVQQSGLEINEHNREKIGVIISSAIGGIRSLQEATFTLREVGPHRISPFAIPMLMSNGAAAMVAIEYGVVGPCFSVASACASGADGIGMAWMMLRAGMIEAAIAGASEATITEVGIGAFDRLGAMSRRGPEVDGDYATPRPFDRDRDGLVMGEGCGILILETERHARTRGAEILAELAGYGATTDAFHITAPSEDGAGGARALSLALESARVDIDQVDYINAHGTATPLNDTSETRAIKATFGKQAYKIPISSTKSMTGHMMGATAALEAILCVKAVREDIVPPTINYQKPDPECDLDYVPNEARSIPVNVAVSNAFGFGGHNAVLIVKEYN